VDAARDHALRRPQQKPSCRPYPWAVLLPKFGAGLNVVQDSEWINVTVKDYNVPTDYTTYACNVSSASCCLGGTGSAV